MEGFLIAQAGGLRQVFPLTKETTRIGRDPENEIRLSFTTVSHLHASISKTPAGLKIVDRNSRNGVYVNGCRVMEQFLEEGDRIRLGEVELTFSRQDPMAADPSVRSETAEYAVPPAAGCKTATRKLPASRRARTAGMIGWLLGGAAFGLMTGLSIALLRPRPGAPERAADRSREALIRRLKRQAERLDAYVRFQSEENGKLQRVNEELREEIQRLRLRLDRIAGALEKVEADLRKRPPGVRGRSGADRGEDSRGKRSPDELPDARGEEPPFGPPIPAPMPADPVPDPFEDPFPQQDPDDPG